MLNVSRTNELYARTVHRRTGYKTTGGRSVGIVRTRIVEAIERNRTVDVLGWEGVSDPEEWRDKQTQRAREKARRESRIFSGRQWRRGPCSYMASPCTYNLFFFFWGGKEEGTP